MDNKSAIYQMLMGKRGNYECMRTSEEYRKAQSKFIDKYEELQKPYSNCLLVFFQYYLQRTFRGVPVDSF